MHRGCGRLRRRRRARRRRTGGGSPRPPRRRPRRPARARCRRGSGRGGGCRRRAADPCRRRAGSVRSSRPWPSPEVLASRPVPARPPPGSGGEGPVGPTAVAGRSAFRLKWKCSFWTERFVAFLSSMPETCSMAASRTAPPSRRFRVRGWRIFLPDLTRPWRAPSRWRRRAGRSDWRGSRRGRSPPGGRSPSAVAVPARADRGPRRSRPRW